MKVIESFDSGMHHKCEIVQFIRANGTCFATGAEFREFAYPVRFL